MSNSLDPIPEPRREPAHAALAIATQATGPWPLTPLKGGISGALLYRVDARPHPLVLRIEPERVALAHRQRGFACMQAAAAIGVAPRLHFADAISGIAVMDHIEAKPIGTYPGGRIGVMAELGTLIERIQTTAPFPPMFAAQEDLMAASLHALVMSGSFAPGLLDRHQEALARIRTAVPWNPATLVSSHNDPNPRNLLYDGHRLWLVDWELAARNDPLFDLAIATTDPTATPEHQTALVTAALGHAPDDALRARLHVVQLLTRLFYGCIALDAVKSNQRAPDTSLQALSPAQFQIAASQGRLAPDEIGTAFGKMSLAAFIDGCSANDFANTLALASQAAAWFPRRA
jgi:hypothetical protein